MKFTANNNYSETTYVTLDYTLAEEENMELGICSTASGLAGVIIELLKRTTETLPQAEILVDIIMSRIQDQLSDFIKNDLAKEIDKKQEKELYEYMREVFYHWLHDSVKLPIERWKVKYRGSSTLKMEPVLLADTSMIAVLLTNEKAGDLLVELDPKNRGTELFNRTLSEAYIIATVAGDIIFGEESSNPIRKLPVGANADGGLSEAINHLLSNQQEEGGNGL